MQLWKKNFLLTYSLFLILLNISMLVLASSAFQHDFEREVESSLKLKKSIGNAITQLYSSENSKENLSFFFSRNKEEGIYLQIAKEEDEIRSTLPAFVTFVNDQALQIIKVDDKKYFCMVDTLTYREESLAFICMKDASSLYRGQSVRLVTIVLASLGLSAVVGIMLYLTMMRIYKPVNNIAHELRTPLTGIQGYAQYIMAGNLTEEDRFFASGQIVKEAQNLKDIVDKLLIMGNLREGTIESSKINMDQLFYELKEKYPDVEAENGIEYIRGDEILIKSLIHNLVSNAARAGEKVSITAKNNFITIKNDGEAIDKNKLKVLNRNHKLLKEQVSENGYGVNLCHEIIKLHKGKLRYQSTEKMGTMVTIEFPDKIIKPKGPLLHN